MRLSWNEVRARAATFADEKHAITGTGLAHATTTAMTKWTINGTAGCGWYVVGGVLQ